MQRRFIGKRAPKKPVQTLEQASGRLGERGDTLDQKIAKLDRELAGYKKQLKGATSAAAKNRIKQRAMQVLKRKKMYEGQRDQLAQQQFNLDQQDFALSSLRDTAETVATMKESAKALKKEYKKINVDKIEDLQDDLADLMVDAEEVQDIMSREYGLPADVDEADLDAELEALDDDFEFEDSLGDEVGNQTASSDAVPGYLQPSEMPAVPSSRVAEADGATDEFGLPKRVAETS